MTIPQLFLQRYDALYGFWLGGVWEHVPEDLMRRRPHERINTIAWNMWHIARVEDAGLNRFVADRPQVLNEAWMQRLNVPWRHHGSGMTREEADDLSRRIDLSALHAYSDAVQSRTRDILDSLDPDSLDATLQADHVRMVLLDEGLAHRQGDVLLETYTGMTKGKCLMNFGLTHSFQHVGIIDVAIRLHGIEL